MRIRGVRLLALASIAAATAAAEPSRAIEDAFASSDAIVVAERGGKPRGGGRWKEHQDWALKAPRAFERATRQVTRDVLREIDAATDPARRSAREPEPYEVEEPAIEEAPVVEAEPDLQPFPEEPAEPVAAVVEPVAAPVVAEPVPDRSRLWSGAALAAFVLGVALIVVGRRRTAEAPKPAPPAVLRPAPVADSEAATRPRVAADAIETAVREAVAGGAAPFPGGGRYEILEQIGRGGMGVVYKARDKRLDRIVALKRLPDTLESEPRYVELLLREARSAARLNHRNIVTVHDVDREDDAWFITMEFLEGSTVEAQLRARKRIAPRSVVWLAQQVAEGLGYAHERGIVHRDVKPANLFVTRDRTVKLMDFGVAKIVEEARRKRTLIGGTPAYMAPEQASGAQVDGRADLYAFGAMLFELLTGDVPFAEGDPLYHHRSTEAPDPRQRAQGIPDELAALVLALMRKERDERPASAGVVATTLRSIASTLPPVRAVALAFLLLAPLALATPSRAAEPARKEAVVARTTKDAASAEEKKSGWSKAGGWMKRNLDPRRLGGAFKKDEEKQQTAAAPTPAPKKKPAPKRTAAAKTPPKPAPVPESVLAPEPAIATVAPPPLPPSPVVEPAPPETSHTTQWMAVLAIVLSAGALGAQWRVRERESAPPPETEPTVFAKPSALLALPVGSLEEADRTVATRTNATIDVVVEEAIDTAEATPRPYPGGGRYEILEEIGRGGMGVVYKARDKRLDRIVALKRLPDSLATDRNAVGLLLREARSAARLNHRNIVTVHDVDRETGFWFITMELLEGELLSTTLRNTGALPPREVASLGEQVASGLGYAHERGIVHRDVKPANLFLTREGAVKLMDFGVAKILEEARKKRTMVGGTPSYMAPEQSLGDAVDGRTDLYALGATLFEMLTGEVPFAKGDPAYHHHLTAPPDPRERKPGIPPALAELVLALLAKRPDDRPASADVVAMRLREISGNTIPSVR